MTLGVLVQARTARVARGIPVDTGTLFIVGAVAGTTGPDVPTEVRSIADFVAAYGTRTGATIPLYDYLDVFFSEGGKRALVSTKEAAVTTATALARFDPDYGPGQMVSVGTTPATTDWATLITAASAADRVALLDVDSTSDVAAMTALGTPARALTSNDRAAAFGPWLTVPPPAGITGASARTVPASAAVAGLCARVDAQGNPNRAAAGWDFPLQYVTGLAFPVLKTERDTLFGLGINTVANRYGNLQNYGFDTPRAKDDYDPYVQFSAARTRMYIMAQARKIAEPFVFRPIDALGHTAAQLKGALEGMLLGLYNVDGLYGETAAEAFTVEVGASVNTSSTTMAGELHAVCEVRFTKYAQAVIIDLVTVPLAGTVSSS
jgi:hypothetical protein